MTYRRLNVPLRVSLYGIHGARYEVGRRYYTYLARYVDAHTASDTLESGVLVLMYRNYQPTGTGSHVRMKLHHSDFEVFGSRDVDKLDDENYGQLYRS